MNIKRWFYYRFLRLSIKAKWSRNKLPPLSKIQDKTMKITLALIVDKESELLINPTVDGEKYYIKKMDETGGVEKFVTITKSSMGYDITLIGHETIDNIKHHYHYDIWFNDNCGRVIIEKFTRVIRHRRNTMESEICKDDEKTLELVYRKLSSNEEKILF